MLHLKTRCWRLRVHAFVIWRLVLVETVIDGHCFDCKSPSRQAFLWLTGVSLLDIEFLDNRVIDADFMARFLCWRMFLSYTFQ
jgi:hypothetical protein